MQSTPAKPAHRLPGPGMPADHGMTSLGLLMQIGGGLFFGVMTLTAVMTLVVGPGTRGAWQLFVISGLCAARSSYHYSAGRSLVHGASARSVEGPFSALYRYLWIAAIQTVLCAYFLHQLIGETSLVLSMAASWLAWPVALYLLVRSPRIRDLRDQIPRAEDHGLEGASVYMLVFGVVGTLFAGLMLYQLTDLPSRTRTSFDGLAMMGIFALLGVRSVLHLVAGKNGLSGNRLEAARDTRRYTRFAAMSTVIIGIILFVTMGRLGMNFIAIAFFCTIIYLLLAWPRILARFLDQRDVDTYASEPDNQQQRPPDMGLTALGWLLLVGAVHGLAGELPLILYSGRSIDASSLGLFGSTPLSQLFDRSIWLSLGVNLVQLWAAVSLIRMDEGHKLATAVYGVVATLVTLHLVWPFFTADGLLHGMLGGGMLGMGGIALVAQVGIALTIPLSALLLVRRQADGRAQARYRDDREE